MPTLKSKDRVGNRYEEEYASDDGFVVNDYADDEPPKGKLKRKRQKLDKPPAAKRTKQHNNEDAPSGDGERDEEGGIYWEVCFVWFFVWFFLGGFFFALSFTFFSPTFSSKFVIFFSSVFWRLLCKKKGS
jgi:hypothetical protein